MRRKTQGLVNFLRKHEGKEPVKVGVTKRISFPQIDSLDSFEQLCELVKWDYDAGETLPSGYRHLVDTGFIWDTTPIGFGLWSDMYNTGYIHPECYEYLVAWHNMISAGEQPQLEVAVPW